MAAVRKKKKKLSKRQLINRIDSIVKRYGKVRLVSQDADWEPPCDCMCKSCKNKYRDDLDFQDEPDMRRRLITKNGNCQVSYKSSGYKRWSGYSESCFMDNYYDDIPMDSEPKKSVKKTMKYLLEHDEFDLAPILIEYGPRFKRKVKL